MIFLVDATGLYYRSYYALKKANLKNSKGFPTFAIFAFLRSLIKYYKDYKPKDFIFVFDTPLPSSQKYRKNTFSAYKAKRSKIYQNDFKVQIPVLKNILTNLGFLVLDSGFYEADDILGSLAKKLEKEKTDIGIITFDKDLFQIISDRTSIYRIKQKIENLEIWDKGRFIKEYDFQPVSFPDYLALCGDQVDNIPGVPGIGPKTAKNLIKAYTNLEGIYKNIEKIPLNLRGNLLEHKNEVFKYRDLIKLKTDIDVNLKKLQPNYEKIKSIVLDELEMKKLFSEIEKTFFLSSSLF